MIYPEARVCVQCADPGRSVTTRGLCHRCYQRYRKAATATGSFVRVAPTTLRGRLLAKSYPIANGCWEWRGTLTKKMYGRIKRSGGAAALAHRVSYELTYGPVPDGFVLDHRCHSEDLFCPGGDSCLHRRCVNPHHLDVVTQHENLLRSRHVLTTGYAARDRCKNGHLFDEKNTYTRAGGSRQCRACDREARREERSAATKGDN